MKTRTASTALFVIGFFASALPAFAQSTGAPGTVTKPDPAATAQDLANYRSGTAAAVALARTGNVAGAEAAVMALNKTRRNTAAWHIESAQRLLQVAEHLARSGQPAQVATLANRALGQLAQAQALARDDRTKGAIKTLEGSIQERYLASPSAALTSFTAAAQLSPSSARSKEAAERLANVAARQRERAANPGK